MAKLSLNDIANVIVNLSPRSAVRKGFNLGLFIGSSDVIPADERVRVYNSLAAVYDDGFGENTPEYSAASLYFQQSKKPSRIAIGRQVKNDGLSELNVTTTETTDGKYIINFTPTPNTGNKYVYKTAAATLAVPEYDRVLTTGWNVITDGEEITATSGHQIIVMEVSSDDKAKKAGKAIIGVESVPLNLPVNETALEAVRACRDKNTDWYVVTFLDADKDDILQISEYIETATPNSLYAFTSKDQDALTGNKESIFALLKALNRRRTFGQYSETDNAIAAIVGYAMGANNRTSYSAYTLMHKKETGVFTDDLTDTQVSYLQKANANYYVSRGYDGEYSMFENGVMSDGTYFDEMINLDSLVNDMQLAIMDLFNSRPKIPQTESGMNQIKLAIKPPLEERRKIGFIAPGKWNGGDIYLTATHCALETGGMMPNGYMILSEPIDSQSQADRDERKSPPIYTPIKLAGAIHTVLVQIDVNR